MTQFNRDANDLVSMPKVLYSVNTSLAYFIAEQYYKGIHYAWFSPLFDFGIMQPASSNPRSICHSILEAIASDDHHCEKLDRIRAGILRGVYDKKKSGIIDHNQENLIRALVTRTKSDLTLLMPVVYVSSWNLVEKLCDKIGPERAAAAHSQEYLCRTLPRKLFDTIEFGKILSNIECFERRPCYEIQNDVI